MQNIDTAVVWSVDIGVHIVQKRKKLPAVTLEPTVLVLRTLRPGSKGGGGRQVLVYHIPLVFVLPVLPTDSYACITQLSVV